MEESEDNPSQPGGSRLLRKLLPPARACRLCDLKISLPLIIGLNVVLQFGGAVAAGLLHLSPGVRIAYALGAGLGVVFLQVGTYKLYRTARECCQAYVRDGTVAIAHPDISFYPLNTPRKPVRDQLSANWQLHDGTIDAGRSWLTLRYPNGASCRLRGDDLERFASLLVLARERGAGMVYTTIQGSTVELEHVTAQHLSGWRLALHSTGTTCILPQRALEDLCDWLTGEQEDKARIHAAHLAGRACRTDDLAPLITQLEQALSGIDSDVCHPHCAVATAANRGSIIVTLNNDEQMTFTRTLLAETVRELRQRAS